jgi:DNA-directed RNA polymerase specialized sigma24 family protein
MPQEAVTPRSSLIPPQPIPAGMQEFTDRVHSLLDGHPKDSAAVDRALEGMDAIFDLIAAGLYNLASMLVGEGEDSVKLVETAVANAEVSASDSVLEARKKSRLALCSAALDLIARRDPSSLAAPAEVPAPHTCIEDDELDAVGVSAAELERLFAGPDRDRVRKWLAELPPVLRTVFALRAVAGFTAAEAAALMAAHGGAAAAGWTPESVREIFRQGLCSLASQLLHASTAR